MIINGNLHALRKRCMEWIYTISSTNFWTIGNEKFGFGWSYVRKPVTGNCRIRHTCLIDRSSQELRSIEGSIDRAPDLDRSTPSGRLIFPLFKLVEFNLMRNNPWTPLLKCFGR